MHQNSRMIHTSKFDVFDRDVIISTINDSLLSLSYITFENVSMYEHSNGKLKRIISSQNNFFKSNWKNFYLVSERQTTLGIMEGQLRPPFNMILL